MKDRQAIPPPFRKADIAVLLTLCLSSIICWRLFLFDNSEATNVEITANGAQVMLFPLSESEDRDLEVQGLIGTSKIRIEKGSARFTSSPCPHELCVKMGTLRHRGHSAACVPNRVLLRLVPSDPTTDRGLDGISR